MCSANDESDRVALEGWEHVVIEQTDGSLVQLKIADHPTVGGYLLLLKRRSE